MPDFLNKIIFKSYIYMRLSIFHEYWLVLTFKYSNTMNKVNMLIFPFYYIFRLKISLSTHF